MIPQRKAIFEPIAHAISDQMEAIFGKGKGTVKPYDSPQQRHTFEAECIPCPKCDAMVAFLVYAPEADTAASLEDYARLGFAKAKEFDVPAWVLGKEQDVLVNNQYEGRFLSLKIWPERGLVKYILGTEMDDLLCPLVENHCSKEK